MIFNFLPCEKRVVCHHLVNFGTNFGDNLFVFGIAENAVNEVNEFVDSPIGYLTETLYGEPSLYGPSKFMDFKNYFYGII